MSKAIITESLLTDIGDAIRAKNGESTLYTPEEMAEAIDNLETGGGTPTLQAKTNIAPTESSQTITADSDYDGLSSVQINAISSSYVGSGVTRRSSSDLSTSGATVTAPAGYYETAATKTISSGSTATPATTITANPSISVSAAGLITASASASQNVTPTVSAGYVSSGTAGTITVSGSNTQQLTTQAATSVTPSTSTQTVGAAGRYMTGAVTVNPIPSQYIVPSGSQTITENNTYDVTNLASVIVNVAASGKAFQFYNGGARVAATSYTATTVTLTVAKAGTYDVYWSGFRSSTSSGTNGSQLYKNGSSVGSAFTTFTDSYWQAPHLTNQTFNEDDVLVVRARSRATNAYMCVANLLIVEV